LGWLEAIHPDDRNETQAAWREALSKGEYYVEHRIRNAPSGDYRWHQTRAVPLAHSANVAATEWVGTMTDIHELRMLQERQRVLLAEVQHRTRNLLAVVQSLARQTMKSSRSVTEFAEEYEGRLGALSRIQALLARTDNEPIDLRELVEGELEAHGHVQLNDNKIKIEGPSVLLPSASAQLMSLGLHELATNAVKHGALGQPSGRLIVRWEIKHNTPTPLALVEWRETGVAMPRSEDIRQGYGSELIERALPFQLGAKTSLEFAPDGVRCEIAVPIATRDLLDD
jgi:two-component sensor histidine kinase